MPDEEPRLVDAFWNLRDDAYDHSVYWNGLTAEAIFQRLAEYVEDAEERGDPIDWIEIAARMIAWRANKGDPG